jgi:ADP-ribosylglycohydrolase
MTTEHSIHNSLHSLAYGDAWGNDTEFVKDFKKIFNKHPEFPEKAFITDDTQMSIYALRPLLNNWDTVLELNKDPHNKTNAQNVRIIIANSFLEWEIDPKNNRAPGATCLNALTDLRESAFITGLEGSIIKSKGCGANMRDPWYGLLPVTEDTLEELSLLQCEITHGHPLALSSAVLTAFAVRAVHTGEVELGKNDLYVYLITKAKELLYRNVTLKSQRPAYIQGLRDIIDFLISRRQNVEVFSHTDITTDVCVDLRAEGWIAEEALLLGAVVADTYVNEPIEGLRRLVYSSGDSDSIAAIGGAILGVAHKEKNVFPQTWKPRLEEDYSSILDDLQNKLEQI